MFYSLIFPTFLILPERTSEYRRLEKSDCSIISIILKVTDLSAALVRFHDPVKNSALKCVEKSGWGKDIDYNVQINDCKITK